MTTLIYYIININMLKVYTIRRFLKATVQLITAHQNAVWIKEISDCLFNAKNKISFIKARYYISVVPIFMLRNFIKLPEACPVVCNSLSSDIVVYLMDFVISNVTVI